jgi:NADH-quinone oxidoreductase subunit M
MLAWTIYSSLIGMGILMLLPRENARAARATALLTAIIGFAIALAGFLQSKPGEIQTITDASWIPSLGIRYHLAADGISLTLVVLTGIAAIGGILFSWNIETRTKEFFAFYLALIAGVYGVFLSFDLFTLFVFYELAIIPKYFLIAIWGSTRREYGAMKLALYSFIGSAMVLVGIIAAFVVSGAKSTDLFELAKYPFSESFQMWAFPLVFVGFAILAGMWPFHTPRGRRNETRRIWLSASCYDTFSSRARPVECPHSGPDLMERCVRHSRSGRDRLRRNRRPCAKGFQICDRLLERQPHGLRAPGFGDS